MVSRFGDDEPIHSPLGAPGCRSGLEHLNGLSTRGLGLPPLFQIAYVAIVWIATKQSE